MPNAFTTFARDLRELLAPTLVASQASGNTLPLAQEVGAELATGGGPSLRSLAQDAAT